MVRSKGGTQQGFLIPWYAPIYYSAIAIALAVISYFDLLPAQITSISIIFNIFVFILGLYHTCERLRYRKRMKYYQARSHANKIIDVAIVMNEGLNKSDSTERQQEYRMMSDLMNMLRETNIKTPSERGDRAPTYSKCTQAQLKRLYRSLRHLRDDFNNDASTMSQQFSLYLKQSSDAIDALCDEIDCLDTSHLTAYDEFERLANDRRGS